MKLPITNTHTYLPPIINFHMIAEETKESSKQIDTKKENQKQKKRKHSEFRRKNLGGFSGLDFAAESK